MSSKAYGERDLKADNHSNESAIMKHKEMFLQHIVRPFGDAFHGMFEQVWLKIILFITGLPGLLALDLFSTPQVWWKGLIWLVVLDWIAGTVTAIYRGTFDWHICTRKWYMATGYLIVCSMAAILSNAFPDALNFVQYIVYSTFFLKEFVSTLKTFKVLALFKVMWKAFIQKKMDIQRFQEFKEAVDERAESEKQWYDNGAD